MSLKLNGGVSQCGACSLIFKSVTSFDEHRTGKHGAGRRCLTEAELRAAGLEPNERGQWRRPFADRGQHFTSARPSAPT